MVVRVEAVGVRLAMTQEEASLYAAIGTAAFLRARAAVEHAELVDVLWQPENGQAHGRLRGPHSGSVKATMTFGSDGSPVLLDGSCTCGSRPECAHPAALVLLVLAAMPGPTRTGSRDVVPRQGKPARAERRSKPAAWERAVAALVGDPVDSPTVPASDGAELGLQFDLVASSARKPGAMRTWRVAIRPVVPGRTGWIRSGISWSSLGYTRWRRGSAAERHVRLLNEILMLSTAGGDRQYYGYHQPAVYLDGFESRRIWDLLAEAEETGLPLVQAGKGAVPVAVSRRPARMSVQADRAGDELMLVPTLLVDGVAVAPECSLLVGRPAHGVVWWAGRGEREPQPKDRMLRLAPLKSPLPPDSETALVGPEIRIPARDERRFFQEFYPGLLRRLEVVPADEQVELPDLAPGTLTLTVDRIARHDLALRWQWTQPIGDQLHGEPLHAPAPAGHQERRDDVIRQVFVLVARHLPGLLEPASAGPRLAETATVAGDDVIFLMNDVVPRLTEMDGVDVVLPPGGSTPAHREVHEAPAFTFSDGDAVVESDWFDLAVGVAVGGEEVPFDELFVALAQGRQYLILPSGAYFSLDRTEFHQLRELIDEARALEDAPAGVLRVGRFQAGLWQDIAELGEITGEARAWQRTVRALTERGDTVERVVPDDVQATLRPYQREGFAWLAALYDTGLGGILADDMGLGKTLQTLALICHARSTRGPGSPFLVVTPASVVHNWVSEAARFTPELTIRAVTQTEARRGCGLAEATTGADVVVTSYTLFRLEFDDYRALKWDGLVLDEAQFIKNAQAVAHRCAKRLPSPFKLAITGTPMENNLAELWALCSVTAPGLFPRLDRFTEYYRNPIEKGHDAERLAQLRRRVRPLMLRRRKSDVACDLPDKQEQVIELELAPKHRKMYQTYLQRERQKVLGLLGDLEQHRFEIFRSLTLLRQASLDVTLVDPKHRGVPSTKLDVLTEQVTSLVAEGHRTLVFSQFTRFLAAARARLEDAGVPCCYLDGSTRDRARVLADFKSGTAPVFLISLKAGGFGLNLTEADYCILLDPWWNPATEAQAVDRVHRIGQTRSVMVYRLVAKDTIEEKVMALKARKAELFSSVLDGGDFASARLTASDIRALLE